MTPRWESPLDRPTTRDAALLAEVMGALERQLTERASHETPDAEPGTLPDEVEDLISAAVAELQRVDPYRRTEGGIAPVLGAGVLQELLRRRSGVVVPQEPLAAPSVDHRL